jgi:alpha/beta superfamily hydrolase
VVHSIPLAGLESRLVATNLSFDLAGPAGRLEALLMNPEVEPVGAAVVCHAHPLQGGMMHFKVVFRAAKALQLAGLAVLRFNFRGVGRSEGVHDDGNGEQDDARAAIDEMRSRHPGLPLLVGGFSFGSWVALRVAARDRAVAAVFALGFPARTVADDAFLDAIEAPRLFVQGERDAFGPASALAARVEGLRAPREMVVIPGADHFFEGHLDELQGTIADWARRRPWA